MRLTATCKYCSSEIHYEEEDVGFEVYCDSCGRSQVAGAAAEPPQDQKTERADAEHRVARAAAESNVSPSTAAVAAPVVSVFSDQGAVKAEDQIVGEETCLCGHRVAVRVADYGSSVYCPACNTEIRVGQTLAEGKYVVARRAPDESAPQVAVRKSRLRPLRSPLSLLAIFVVFGALLSGIYLNWERPGLFSMIRESDEEAALTAQPGTGPLGGAPRPEEQTATPASPRKRPSPPPPAPLKVTQEMIEGLLKRPDLSEALVDAQIWQETLRDQGAPNEDPRRVRLAAVTKAILEKLSPPPGPPPHLAEFRKLVDALAQALQAGNKAENLAEARKAFEAAEAYFEAHKESLVPYAQRLVMLRSWLRELESVLEGVTLVRKWLDEAARAAAADDVTRAMESEAKARFCALDARPTKSEAEELDQRYRQVRDEIIFARGKRAVADARRCEQAGDRRARNRQVRRAFNELSGLPEPRVKPVLDEIRAWWEEMDKAELAQLEKPSLPRGKKGGRRIPGTRVPKAPRQLPEAGPSSPVAEQIVLRDRYEEVLAPYYQDVDHKVLDLDALVDACLAFEDALGDDETSQKLHDRAGNVLFDALEREARRKLKAVAQSDDEQRRLKELLRLRQLLDWTEPWKASRQWLALDSAIRQEGGRLAEKWLKEAVTLAKDDKLQAAAERATAAAGLGEARIADRASALRDKCLAELKLRADRKAEAESWQRIQDLRRRRGSELDLCKELEIFSRRFPGASHGPEASQLKLDVRQAAEQKAAEAVRQAAGLFDHEDYQAAREQLDRLRYAPIPPSLASALADLKRRLGGLKQRGDEEFLALSKRAKLFTEADVVAVLEALPRILAMDPEHEEAQQLLQKATQAGESRARKLVETARPFREIKPDVYRDKLERAARSSPEGPFGTEARGLLKEL
jgi:hypothetical protein